MSVGNSHVSYSQSDDGALGVIKYPISAITTFTSRNWSFVGRCTSKSDIKHYTGRDGNPSRLASCEIIDTSGDIRLTFFNDVCIYIAFLFVFKILLKCQTNNRQLMINLAKFK